MHADISDPVSSAVAQPEHRSLSARRGLRRLQRSFARLEGQRRDLRANLSNWPEEARHFRPSLDSWSALDVIDHLMRVECEALAYIKTQLSNRDPVTIQERIGSRIVFAVMLSPLRIKTPPTVPTVLPSGCAEEGVIFAKWHDVRKDIKLLIDGLQPHQLTSALFHHPVSGSMSIHEALTFLSVHGTHHGYQLRRIRTAFGKRKR